MQMYGTPVANYNWTKDLEPLSQKALKEMAFVVNGILSGELAHYQGAWHKIVKDKEGYPCGTAHCVAGWCELLGKRADKQKKSFFKVPTTIPVDKIDYFFGNDNLPERLYDGFEDTRDAADYARERWGMTSREANAMFAGDNSKQQLKSFLNRFEKGLRITYNYGW